ncbi:hypothetical protein DFQ28_008325 [Apophysomyces sp. BC1034]|nr:hypothetical protein DFQ29_007125 [Apophysomyces sp. BC1021]KAG0186104.1 hypothetical protein DFQ28_008325 [Apophysomyces sp. BC1034]
MYLTSIGVAPDMSMMKLLSYDGLSNGRMVTLDTHILRSRKREILNVAETQTKIDYLLRYMTCSTKMLERHHRNITKLAVNNAENVTRRLLSLDDESLAMPQVELLGLLATGNPNEALHEYLTDLPEQYQNEDEDDPCEDPRLVVQYLKTSFTSDSLAEFFQVTPSVRAEVLAEECDRVLILRSELSGSTRAEYVSIQLGRYVTDMEFFDEHELGLVLEEQDGSPEARSFLGTISFDKLDYTPLITAHLDTTTLAELPLLRCMELPNMNRVILGSNGHEKRRILSVIAGNGKSLVLEMDPSEDDDDEEEDDDEEV